MKNSIAYRKATPVKTLLQIVIAITFLTVWLPLLRALFDGSSYQWGVNYFGYIFHGAGLTADYIFLIVQLMFYTGLFYSLYWVRNRKICYGLLLAWFIHVFGNLFYDIIKNGDTMFHGDTLNVHVNITWIVITLAILALALIGIVIVKDLKEESVNISWSAKNSRLAIFILSPLVLQAILFMIGEPHETTDEIGVIISLAQNFFLPFIFRPMS